MPLTRKLAVELLTYARSKLEQKADCLESSYSCLSSSKYKQERSQRFRNGIFLGKLSLDGPREGMVKSSLKAFSLAVQILPPIEANVQ